VSATIVAALIVWPLNRQTVETGLCGQVATMDTDDRDADPNKPKLGFMVLVASGVNTERCWPWKYAFRQRVTSSSALDIGRPTSLNFM